MTESLSQNIRYLRQTNKMTQQALADILGQQRGRITAWELGTGKPKYNMLIKLSELFEVNLDDLMSNDLTKIKMSNKKTIGDNSSGENKIIERLSDTISKQSETIEKLVSIIHRMNNEAISDPASDDKG